MVFSDALGIDKEKVHDLAYKFVCGQSIPSVIVDSYLDFDNKNEDAISNILFSNVCNLSSMNSLFYSYNNKIFESYIRHVNLMYSLMWSEYKNIYFLPPNVDKKYIYEYIYGENSRLVSSVFFGIGVEWAHILKHGYVSNDISLLSDRLRRLRQLNDEISDWKKDISIGLVTLPFLNCIENKEYSQSSLKLIGDCWDRDESHYYFCDKLHEILVLSGAFYKSSLSSLKITKEITDVLSHSFTHKNCFDIGLLINLRVCRLVRIIDNNWLDLDKSFLHDPSFNTLSR